VLQGKLTLSQQPVNQPGRASLTPPAYRPQSTPKVLQAKIAREQHQHLGEPARGPVAPAAIRPQPSPKIVQPAMRGSRTDTIQPSFWEQALSYGGVGAVIGARGGFYGALIGGVIGAGYGIYNEVMGQRQQQREDAARVIGSHAKDYLARKHLLASEERQRLAEARVRAEKSNGTIFINAQGTAKGVRSDWKEYYEYYKKNRNAPVDQRPFIIHYNNSTARDFNDKLEMKRKFLWTIDTDGILSIGSPQHNFHAVVAAFADVFAAGTGAMETSKEEDAFFLNLELERLYQQVKESGVEDKFNHYYPPPSSQGLLKKPEVKPTRRVILDFDSGHYHPSKCWAVTEQIWGRAGYVAVKSTTGRHNPE
jgi:hypothetical protein